MFYAQFVLSKKGPLAKIWLAAHWEKKLSKAQIYETNVDEAVDEIIQPKSKMALRTTGHLLLGIVRIYSKKTKYLLADCNEAFLKIKLAFRPGQLDAPNEKIPYQTTFSAIPDMFGDFDATLPEFNEADYLNCQVSQSRVDDITLKEDNIAESTDKYNTNFDDDDFGEAAAGVNFDEDYGDFSSDNTFGFEFGRDNNTVDSLFGREREPTPCLDNAHAPGNAIFGEEDFCDGGEPMDEGGEEHDLAMDSNSEIMPLTDINPLDMDDNVSVRSFNTHTTNENESYQLELMESYYERQERKKRKRRLLVDEYKNISGDEMKANMADYRDTLNILDLSPPTRKLMRLKAVGTAEKLFHLPGSNGICAKPLIRQYQQRLYIEKNPERREEKNETIKNMLGLGEILEEEFNYPEVSAQDNAFNDDFAEVGEVDFDSYENSSPVQIELQEETQLLPVMQQAMELDDSFSPNEKKKKRERLVEEEEPAADGDDDNRWSKRTQSVLNSIVNKINHSEDEEIALADLLTKGSTRKTAAQKFYTLLVLKKWQAIDLQQAEPYEEIFISSGPNMGQTLGQ